MAFIKASITNEQIDGATYTQAIPVPHASGDIMLATVYNNSSAGSAMSASGWTSAGATTTVGSMRAQVFWKLAASSSESPISVSGQNAQWVGNIKVIGGADTSSPIDIIGNADLSVAGGSHTSTTVSVTNNNALVVHSFLLKATGSVIGRALPQVPSDLTYITKFSSGNNNALIMEGYRNQAASGTSTAVTAIFNTTSVSGRAFTIAIKDANPSSPSMGPDSRNTYDVVKLHMGITGAAGSADGFSRHETTVWNDFNGVAATTIGGLSIIAGTPTALVANIPTENPWGGWTGISVGVSAVDATGRWVGAYHTLSSYDFSNKIVSLTYSISGVAASQFGTEGVIIYFEDGSNNWAAFQLSKRTGMESGAGYTAHIAVGQATPYDSSGSIDWTDIAKVGYAYHKVTSSTVVRVLSFRLLTTMQNVIAFGGSANAPLTTAFFGQLMNNWGTGVSDIRHDLAPSQGQGQLLSKCSIQYGDGTNQTYVDLSANSNEQKNIPDGSFDRQFWQGAANMLTTKFNTTSTDVVRINRSILSSPIQQTLDFNNGSAPATFASNGCTIIRQLVTARSGITFNRTTFDTCGTITANTAAFDTCTISSSSATSAIVTADPEGISNSTFTSAGTGHAIQATATGTFDFVGNSFSGYAGTDGSSGNEVFYNNSGGAITLLIPAGDDVPTVRNGAGASTTITQPTDNQSVTISGAVAGSRIEIYDLTSSTQLYEGTPTFPYTWTDGSAYVADRQIRLRCAYVNGDEAKEFIEVIIGTSTSTTPALAYLVSQVDDAVYNSNAIDGSAVTDITIDDGTMLLELSASTETWQDMYAYEMYWLFTSTGIADLGQSITAPDTANYLMDEDVLTVKNVSGSATVITGGWGRSVNTGSPLDIIDLTGDPLFASPPHVVPYAVGSAVTPTDITDIASASRVAVWSDTDTYTGSEKGNVLAIAADDADTAANK